MQRCPILVTHHMNETLQCFASTSEGCKSNLRFADICQYLKHCIMVKHIPLLLQLTNQSQSHSWFSTDWYLGSALLRPRAGRGSASTRVISAFGAAATHSVFLLTQ